MTSRFSCIALLLLAVGCNGGTHVRIAQGEDREVVEPEDSASMVDADGGLTDAGCTERDLSRCGDLRALMLPVELPEARGNVHAESFEAAVFGFRVFFDARFSSNLKVRCQSCHSVERAFVDGEPVPTTGTGEGVRNSPTVLNVARHRAYFWDGRVDNLWSQPLQAFENPSEMNFSRLEIVHLLSELYVKEYAAAFGPLPDFSDRARFPAAGRPGEPAFDAMSEADKLVVNEVVANLGKALEAYMRKVATGPSAVDRHLAAALDVDAGYAPPRYAPDAGADYLDDRQQRGLAVFVNAGCPDCHSGPNYSDDKLHNLGVPARAGATPDPGLSDQAIAELSASPFNAVGPYYEGADGGALVLPVPVLGGFRTPSLRNIRKTAPYGHSGVFATLEEVIDFHLRGGGQDPSTFVGTVDEKLVPRSVSTEDREALIEFLNALDGEYPPLPWSQWPSGNG